MLLGHREKLIDESADHRRSYRVSGWGVGSGVRLLFLVQGLQRVGAGGGSKILWSHGV